MSKDSDDQFLKSLVKIDRIVEKCEKLMRGDYSCCLQRLPIDAEVWFIPYTTDRPQLKRGVIKFDSIRNDKFIAYDGYTCDDGNWHICETRLLKISNDELYLINKKLMDTQRSQLDII